MKNLNPLDLLKEVAIHDFESDYYKKEGQKASEEEEQDRKEAAKKREEKRQGLLRMIERRKQFGFVLFVVAFFVAVFILKSENVISIKKKVKICYKVDFTRQLAIFHLGAALGDGTECYKHRTSEEDVDLTYISIAIPSLCIAVIVCLIYYALFIKPRKAEFKYLRDREFDEGWPGDWERDRRSSELYDKRWTHKEQSDRKKEEIKKIFDEVDKLG
jgi:hypothetical protein